MEHLLINTTSGLLGDLVLHRATPHLFFLAFAIIIVHACQHLVEQVTQSIEPEDRKATLNRASFCLGALVWSLDVGGFTMYPGIHLEDARLAAALMALVLMILIARVLVPLFATTNGMGKAWLAALGMGFCVLFVHLSVASSVGLRPIGIRFAWLALALVVAIGIAGGMAAMHRYCNARHQEARGVQARGWAAKAMAGLGVVALHRLLNAAVPLESRQGTPGEGIVPALLALVLFTVIIGMDQIFGTAADQKRREVFDQALALLRSATVPATGEQGRLLFRVADRVESILDKPGYTMHFQPMLMLDGPGGEVRFEALMRPGHPDLGAIQPELFFLACARRGLTPRADRNVLRESLLCSLPWMSSAPRCRGIAVNVGPQTLLEPGFLPWIQDLLRELRVPWRWLEVEITEHAMVAHSGPLRQVLGALSRLGVGTWLDDFGAGFSSLGLLPGLPISGIKCDRSLLLDACAEPTRLVILGKICEMAAALNIATTVEGIERTEDLEAVLACGASHGQGYLLGRPMPAAEVAEWMERPSPLPRMQDPCAMAD